MNIKRWLALGVLLGVVAIPQPARAFHVQDVLRFLGLGWGDGYHAPQADRDPRRPWGQPLLAPHLKKSYPLHGPPPAAFPPAPHAFPPAWDPPEPIPAGPVAP